MAKATTFHDSIERARSYQKFTGVSWLPADEYITLRNRSLTYRFSTHFHPHVASLIQRLNALGFPALQDADTLYLPQPNPPAGQPMLPLRPIPGSTRATLMANVTGQRPQGGPAVALSAGTPLLLPDGCTITVPANTVVSGPDGSQTTINAALTFATPGLLPATASRGIQTGAGAAAVIVPDFTIVTIALAAGTSAVLTNDGSAVILPAGTSVAVHSGKPQPYYFTDDFAARYAPDVNVVDRPYPVKDLDFAYNGAYAIYNWELFFHAPLLIAIHLGQNQKFDEAQRWFHYIFNPTDNTPGPTPERFWKVAPFQYTDVRMIEEVLVNLAQKQDGPLYDQTVSSINEWMEHPFQPWAVAKFRPSAYILKTVMAYLDNLIAWGDSLFQQYTVETINEATQLYVLAANILGERPQAVPKKGAVTPLTYNELRANVLDPFGNTMVDMEVDIPFDLTAPSTSSGASNGSQILPSIGKTLYFCIPRNDKLLRYWDTVADRLFKIHNSLNLQGVFQKLPLFDPPIDPALLVRAAAAGLDVSSIVSGLNQPLPLVRFQLLVAKAGELCQEVKALGGSLLSAIEKQDNEAIALLRSKHEQAILGLANVVRYAQWQEAAKATQALQASLSTAVQRYAYYQKMLGRTDAQITSSLPQLDALDVGSLNQLQFSQIEASSEPSLTLDPIDAGIAQDATAVSDGEVKTLSINEVEELDKLSTARALHITASALEALGSGLAIIPQFKAHAQPMGCGASVDFGGQHLHSMASGLAAISRAVAEEFSFQANKAGKLAGYGRRELDWTLQSNSARSEISQIFKQVRAAQIREAIARKEYDNHQVQMAHAQQIVDFLQGQSVGGGLPTKQTTVGFYTLMKRQVKGLYAKAFQLAYDAAKKAERALQFELGDTSRQYIQFNYLDGAEGLLAGEKLVLDVKAMEMAYHDLNQREYELTKHVSLLQVDPMALLQLRATGSCLFTMPEELFDLDGPGHYFRRIKSAAVTLPCVAGPYTSVTCTLTLQQSAIRVMPDAGKAYARQGSEDPRFSDYYGSIQSIVTSSGQADSGMFDTNLRDERYLPFEGAGAAGSVWRIALPSDVRQFDFNTIADVVVTLRYTAREGGELLKAAAVQNLQASINKAQTVGSVRLFSIRHDFPSEWARFKSVTIVDATATAPLSIALRAEHYPFWAQEIVGTAPVKAVQLFADLRGKTQVTISDAANRTDALVRHPQLGSLLAGRLTNIPKPAAITDATHPALALRFDNNAMSDLWLALTWGK